MKTPIINIFASKNRNMTHYIYRSEGEPIEKTLEEFISNRTPVGVIDEASDSASSITMREVTMLKDKYPKGYSDFIQLSAPFNFNIGNNEYTINLRNNTNGKNDITLKISLGADSVISITKTENNVTTNYDNISNNFIFKNNAILIHSDICIDYKTITFTGDINVYKFYDIGKVFEGIHPDRGHGVYKPVLRTVETIKYIDFFQDADYRKNTYYYYVISKDANGNISDISNTQVIEVAEELIDFTLYESADYYDNDNPTFTEVKIGEPTYSIGEIKIDKSNIHSSIISTENINIYPYSIDSENKRLVYVTNVWNSNNRHLMNRNRKAYKAVNSFEGIKTESDIFTFEESQEEVLIDKIEILKKDVTGLSEDEAKTPLDYRDDKASVIKVFIRQGGVYYEDFFLGKNMETNDYDYPEYLVSSITLDSRFPLLKINDVGIKGNKYNYTMYLYDEDKNISSPIVKVV